MEAEQFNRERHVMRIKLRPKSDRLGAVGVIVLAAVLQLAFIWYTLASS